MTIELSSNRVLISMQASIHVGDKQSSSLPIDDSIEVPAE